MTKDCVHGVGHSPVCQILLQIVVRAVITSSPPAWTSSAGCCRLQLTSLSSMIVLQPKLLCKGWGGHPLCLSGDSSLLMDLHWPCSCTAQSSILFIGSVGRRKGSTMNSTATCSTWRGMDSVRLYFARDSSCDDNKQQYHTGSVAARVNKDCAFRPTPGRRC